MKRLLPLVVLLLFYSIFLSQSALAIAGTIDWKGQTWTFDSDTTASINGDGHLVLKSSSFSGSNTSVSVAGKAGFNLTIKGTSKLVKLKTESADKRSSLLATMDPDSYQKVTPQIEGFKNGDYSFFFKEKGEKMSFTQNDEMTFSVFVENDAVEYSLGNVSGNSNSFSSGIGFATAQIVYGGFMSTDTVIVTNFEFITPSSVKHTVSVDVGENGSGSASGDVQVSEGRIFALTLTPDSGYVVDQVILDGVAVQEDQLVNGEGFEKKLILKNVISSHSVKATFKEHPPVNVNISVVGEGTVTPKGTTPVSYNGSLSIEYTPAEGYELEQLVKNGSKEWSPANPYVLRNVTEPVDISVEFKAKEYSISINKQNWNGSVDPYMSPRVQHGKDQRIAFSPNSGYAVGEVIVDNNKSYYGIPSYTFKNVTKQHSVSVDFVTAAHTVTPSAPTNGTIFPSAPVKVAANGKATFFFEPENGFTVKQVLVNGEKVAGDVAEYTIEGIDKDTTVSVEFEGSAVVEHTVTPQADLGGSINPSSPVTVADAGSQRFTFTPNSGYRVYQVFVDGNKVADSVTSYLLSNITDDKTIRVSFESIRYTVNAQATTGGTISPSGSMSLQQGSSKTFTFAPQDGYAVKEVRVDNVKVAGNVASYTLANVSKNTTVKVGYEQLAVKRTITVSSNVGGRVSEEGAIKIDDGSSKTFTFTPETGYQVKKLLVDGAPVTTASSYTFSSVSKDHTLAVEFAKKEYSVTVSTQSHGTISASSPKVVHGGSVTFTVSPAVGYKLSTFTVNSKTVAVTGTKATVNNVASNLVVAAVFVEVSSDSDNDGLDDAWEMEHFGSLDKNGTEDSDNDGLSDLDEYRHGSEPNNSDSDGDGMPDGWEIEHGLSVNVNDANLDSDGDGFSNLEEFLKGSDPNDKNSVPTPTVKKASVPILKLLMD